MIAVINKNSKNKKALQKHFKSAGVKVVEERGGEMKRKTLDNLPYVSPSVHNSDMSPSMSPAVIEWLEYARTEYNRGVEQGKREERQRIKEVAGSIAWVSVDEPTPQVTVKTKRIFNRALEDLCRAIDYIDDYKKP